MRGLSIGLMILLTAGTLTACGGAGATTSGSDGGGGATYTSAVLSQSYAEALDVPSQMILGTMRLEETANAVTPEQAKALLPLWQALQGGVTAEAEVNAVLKQIEAGMTPEQLQAIAAMQLTQEDLRAWMEEQGPGAGVAFRGAGGGQDLSPEELATRQAQFADGEVPPEMATRRAEFANMSEEERAALRATAEADGSFPGGAGGGASGAPAGQRGGGLSFRFLLVPLVQMLEARAGDA